MMLYKVSLFDDSEEGKRKEIGLNTNGGFVLVTTDYEKAREAFHNELVWMKEHSVSSNLREKGDVPGVSVNIAKAFRIDEECKVRWNWIEQSFRDYIL